MDETNGGTLQGLELTRSGLSSMMAHWLTGIAGGVRIRRLLWGLQASYVDVNCHQKSMQYKHMYVSEERFAMPIYLRAVDVGGTSY